MSKLDEKQILQTVHLSDMQKVVMAKIAGSATEQVAHEEISAGRNLVAARNVLQKLGLIDVTDSTATITEKGQEVMKDENMVDETGSLTAEGNKFAQVREPQDLKAVDKQQAAPEPQAGGEPASASEDIPMESLKLVQSVNRALREKKELEIFTLKK